jgi:two-component system sensor histidine kinase KdpD
MARGQLRIYLGAAPGVGKTFAMLGEGRRRVGRGTDVVIGVVETHGRLHTAEQIGELEVVPRRTLVHRDCDFVEMDVDAVLARHPAVALVDELAHTNVPGSRNAKRWQDVEELLAAGVDVVSTLNIQHLESLNDVVESITGIAQRETIPDAVVRQAEQVELVDMTPEALRRRMAHGNVYPSERIDTALANYFRPENLAALRELALMWLADRVDDALLDYRTEHGIERPWETRERVVVALTGAPTGGHLIRRASRLAARRSAELVGVHVRPIDGLATQEPRALPGQRRLLADLGGTYHEIAGGDTARALVDFARVQNATQIVLGASRRNRWQEIVRGSVISAVLRSAGSVDVHVISSEDDEEVDELAGDEGDAGAVTVAGAGAGDRVERAVWTRARARRRAERLRRFAVGPFTPRRAVAAWTLATAGPVVATAVLDQLRGQLGLPSDLLVYLLVTVLSASAGGWAPALFGAVTSFLLANWYFTPPIHTFTIGEGENVLALVIFVVVAGLMSVFVAQAARRTSEAARARAQADTLAAMAGTIASDDDPLRQLVGLLRARSQADAVAVLHRQGATWSCEASSGSPVPLRPEDAAVAVPLDADSVLVLDDGSIDDASIEALQTFAQHLALAVDRRRLRAEAAQAARVVEANELRGALLAAVSHDLRTPLASVKASVSSLRQPDVAWSPAQRDEFLEAIEDGADQLGELIANLLGMSRIQAGAVELALRDVGFDEIVPAALVGLDAHGIAVDVDVDEGLPRVRADAALLERAVANLIDNACKWSPPGGRVCVRAAAHAGRLGLLVVDRGPGVPPGERETIFQPFQRLGDGASAGDVSGTGLGLAVARGFVRLMGGEILVEDTPGGGTTMVLTLAESP